MVRMRFAGRIVVVPRTGEVIGTITVLVNVHGIKIRGTGSLFIGKIEYLGFHQYAPIRSLVEFHQAA